MDAAILSLFSQTIGKIRPKNIRKYSDTINWENVNFPPTGQDFKQLEVNNEDIRLNVLQMNDKEKFEYIYKSTLYDVLL